MAASLQAAATLMPAKIGGRASSARPSSHVARAFGVDAGARITCSLQSDIREVASKCADAAKMAGFALATSALLVSGASAEGAPKRLTFDEIQKTKLMTRLTYTLDEMEGPLEVGADGTLKFEEKDGIDYAAVTVQLPGGERVPFLFTVKQLVATGKPESFSGPFLVPSYRGSSFLDPKGRGGSTGYDNAVALPAGGRGDEEELAKENVKNASSSTGNITLSVTKSKPETGEVIGVFESVQPSDTDLGAKAPKDVKIQGVWYAQLESN
ncbi:unnamed protein product [Triticum turgidum subsp. durum]|uniref:33 kDa subunit of oxygen evolving system of photosystem II n=1 Tax=Triticum turgidum subsp. durum TaxID=4567 RepID=A0A9R1NSR9_TRITD|nr:unnamed protein product [Triticum turgidum subsp. durum]VAH46312.1 unnamed protein product [Triticum turgidum subsp. durum]